MSLKKYPGITSYRNEIKYKCTIINKQMLLIKYSIFIEFIAIKQKIRLKLVKMYLINETLLACFDIFSKRIERS